MYSLLMICHSFSKIDSCWGEAVTGIRVGSAVHVGVGLGGTMVLVGSSKVGDEVADGSWMVAVEIWVGPGVGVKTPNTAWQARELSSTELSKMSNKRLGIIVCVSRCSYYSIEIRLSIAPPGLRGVK
jgi:hypothetical protein